MLLVIPDGDRTDLDSKLRRFADFFVLDENGEPTEEWGVFTEKAWLPESFFRTLLRFFHGVGLHFHGPGEWTIDEGLKESALLKLRMKLDKLPERVWLAQLVAAEAA